MAQIFVSYRHDDAAGTAGRIDDRLRAHFGQKAVFMDVDSIPLGVDFRRKISEAVGKCKVLLAVIGPRWAGDGRIRSRRIDDPKDYVRIEIEAALERGIPIIPVLVDGASMPKEADLPASLAPLSFLNGLEVIHGRDFNQHVDHLIRGIDEHLGNPSRKSKAARTTSAAPPTGNRPAAQAKPGKSKTARASGTWVMLGPHFFFAETVRANSDGTITFLVPTPSGEDEANLSRLVSSPFGRGSELSYAWNVEAGTARVQTAESEMTGGRHVWTVLLAPQDHGVRGFATEMSIRVGSKVYSPDDCARLRAGRILLNDPPESSSQKRGFGDDALLEGCVRGYGSDFEVRESAIQRVFIEHGSNPNWKHFARLQAIYALKRSGTVDHILELTLGAVRSKGLAVQFRGSRDRQGGQTPIAIEIAGVCPLG